MCDNQESLNFPINPNYGNFSPFLYGYFKDRTSPAPINPKPVNAQKSDKLSSQLGKRSVDNFLRHISDKTLIFNDGPESKKNFLANPKTKKFNPEVRRHQTEKKKTWKGGVAGQRTLEMNRMTPNFYTPQKFSMNRSDAMGKSCFPRRDPLAQFEIPKNPWLAVQPGLSAGKISLQKGNTYNKLDLGEVIECDSGSRSKKTCFGVEDNILNEICSKRGVSELDCGLEGGIKVFAFSAKTSKGLVRNYNEDKISIVMNMNPGSEGSSPVKPKKYKILY
jgi:hypothetical protein